MPAGRDRSPDPIASTTNPGIKMVRSLQRRKHRQQERAFVVEGMRAVTDTLDAGIAPKAVFIREDFPVDALPYLPTGMEPRRVIAPVFDALTDVAHPQGIVAVIPMLDEPEVPGAEGHPTIMILDGVRDPGNMGTLFRSAAAAGLDHIVIGPESVDPYHPRVVRAAMGSHLRIGFSRRSWDDLTPVLEDYEVVALADATGDVGYDRIPWSRSAAIIIGGEAFGPSSRARDAGTHRVAIPLQNGVESLNAGVAGSLLAFEAARQRRLANS